ncbi:MAG: hypothetical protein DMF61_15570 [Blastocatellia bacterium AA13]|nr:MAG: hypothetical protein DMF61_15570 [Blastocatellia bacterium AA13]
MELPVVILPDPPVNKGLDYVYLKEEGTRLVQELSGDIWTDYNESDPGVTTLEQLCYALTELSYRAEFPLKDLLIDRPNGRIRTRRQALFIPRRIYTCNALTENDYRKLIVDRVSGVENVWLTHYDSRDPERSVNGLYDIWVYAPGLGPLICVPDEVKQLARRVRRVYCRNRSLCEDLHRVHILEPLRTVVEAAVTIGNSQTADAVLAGIFFNVGNLIAPELRREPLKSLMDRGVSPDEIFNGPLLTNGFIDSVQLQAKASKIPVQEIARAIAHSSGVLSVRSLRVRVENQPRPFERNQSIPVEMKNILSLDTDAGPGGRFTIKLFKNGIECKPTPSRVKVELDRLWSEYRRTYRLLPQYKEYFSVPKGEYREIEQYYSIQNQFPNAYGISYYGTPEDSTTERKAQAKQFKGYLMVFDQLMADFFAQLARVRDLYSTDPRLVNTYFYQYLYDSVPDVKPLLDHDYREGLPRIVEGEDPFTARRNRFLDVLLALYAEKLDASSLAETSCENEQGGDGEDLVEAKLALLKRLVSSTHNRGRGFDYLAAPSPGNIAGMEIKSRIQLGISWRERRPLISVLDELGLEIAESESTASIGRPANRFGEHIEEEFIPVTRLTTNPEAWQEAASAVLRGQRATEEFLSAASDFVNYRAGQLPGEGAVTLVCRDCRDKEWLLVGKYPDLDAAAAAARAIAWITQLVNRWSRELYVVEHTLLRFGRLRSSDKPRPETDNECDRDSGYEPPAVPFVYSFTISVIVSTAMAVEIGSEYQTTVREIIRANTPAHIVAEFCFLRPRGMYSFESLYWAWREALRNGDIDKIARTSARLREFLEGCRADSEAEAHFD